MPLSLESMNITPRNDLIQDRRKKRVVKDYVGKEFLIKISAAKDQFGLQPSEKALPPNFPMESAGDDNDLWVYDQFRFVSGATRNDKLQNLVRQFGKLSGEKIYNKRIYLHARIRNNNKNELQVRTDQLLHDQGW